MSVRSLDLTAEYAFGYLHPESVTKYGKDETQKNVIKGLVVLHNVLNGTSVVPVLTPVVAIIRAIVSSILLYIFRDELDKPDMAGAKKFLWAQNGRAALELFFCAGPILGLIVDPIMTFKHYELACFKDKKV
jgi:hypothetical protein